MASCKATDTNFFSHKVKVTCSSSKPNQFFFFFFKDKVQILEWPFTVTSQRHTCVIVILFNQHLYMPYLSEGWIILAKVLANTDLNTAKF